MKKIVILLSLFFLIVCKTRENNFSEKRKMEIFLLYLANKKDKKEVCLNVMKKSQNCLELSSNIPTQAKESEKITPKSLSIYTSKELEFKKEAQDYSEFCGEYSKELLSNTSDQAQACNFSCDEDFWNDKDEEDQCKKSDYKTLFREGFLVKDLKTKNCIQNCFSFMNTKISKASLKELTTYDFFKLMRQK